MHTVLSLLGNTGGDFGVTAASTASESWPFMPLLSLERETYVLCKGLKFLSLFSPLFFPLYCYFTQKGHET